MMKSLLFLLCTILSVGVCAQSQEDYQKILSEYFTDDGPGATAIVAKGREILYQGAAGMADLELQVPMDVRHVFRLGSITKQFTGIAIMMLVEDGEVALDDPLTKFLPDYPTGERVITVEHLLTHTSGIQSYTDMPGFMEHEVRIGRSVDVLIDFFKDEPMQFAPGERWAYNNSGYILLGAIIEKASGQTYEAFVNEHIFEPLGMSRTYYDSHERVIAGRIPGYQPASGGPVNADFIDMSLPYAAGSLLSTVGDLLIWNTAVQSEKLVSRASLDKVFTPYQLNDGSSTNYGYGWSISGLKGSPTYEHGGGIFGFLTNGLYLPDEDVYVAVLSNCNCNDPGPASLKMAALAIGKSVDYTRVEVDPAIYTDYVGVYDIDDSQDFRTITTSDGKLYSQRSNSSKMEVYPMGNDAYFYANSFTTLEFKRNAEGKITGHTITLVSGVSTHATLSDKEISERASITLSADVLSRYAGKYELAPGFVLELIHDEANGRLIGQATGQGQIPLSAESTTHFFISDIGAEIDMTFDNDGNCNGLILNQGGQRMEGWRMPD